MCSQVTDRVLMIKPGLFGSNPDTVADNAFQNTQQATQTNQIHEKALGEFQGFVDLLKARGVKVDVRDDTLKLPDAIFPNNWISFHGPSQARGVNDPRICTYPMMSECRRKERSADLVQSLSEELGADVRDYTQYEQEGQFLEGTGSMVLDRSNSTVYACLSQRTHPDLLRKFSNDFGYNLVSFSAHSRLQDGQLAPIYHTNVLMSVGTSFAVVCLESIMDETERNNVSTCLKNSGKELVPISMQQMLSFAGNMLQLRSCGGDLMLVMSTQAYRSLSQEQLSVFKDHSCSVVHSDLHTIETYGGGGARCMIAEVFPPIQNF